MQLIDSVLPLLLASFDILFGLLHTTCPSLKLIKLLEDHLVSNVWIGVFRDGLLMGIFPCLLVLEFLSFNHCFMGQHVLLVDSEDLGKVQNLELSLFEGLAADSSVNYLLVVFVMSAYNIE